MSLSCEVVSREVTPSVVIRTRCSVESLPGVIGPAYQRIMGHLHSRGAQPAGPPYVGYHNEDMSDLDIEIGFPVTQDFEPDGDFVSSVIPQGRFASTMHIGPYGKIAGAYTRLSEWMHANQLTPSGECYEIYLNDPADTPDDALQTLILFPLA